MPGTMVNDNDDSEDENLDGQVIDLDSESDEETPQKHRRRKKSTAHGLKQPSMDVIGEDEEEADNQVINDDSSSENESGKKDDEEETPDPQSAQFNDP